MKALSLRKLPILIIAVAALLMAFALPTLAEAAEPKAEGPTIHRVQAGETLATIASHYGATTESLMQLNRLRDPNVLYVGQRLLVGPASAAAGANTSGSGMHIVRRGQTLSSIAAQYGTTVSAIKNTNELRTNTIYMGQRLRIPQGGVAASESGSVHTILRGETLASIANRYGTTVDALASLNGISNTSLIQVGQRLVTSRGGDGTKQAPTGPKKVVVDISAQRCKRYQGDELLNTWRCSTGRRGYGTRVGTFRVQSKLRKAYGSTWDIWMPNWLGIYWSGSVENGFHGLPWNASSGARTWAGLVGTPITYGCVMLNNSQMKTLWNWADIGTKIVIKR